ncbi:SusC/RagA family TonB-linked outer membrane protein [Carboxylicivirga sp. A043]|uniref:SusC/RagA family TonB-linked outer membrane protein n=1 Tax=Carboxylicivirga litoralis TaxID=2816963 RepID=UPI0021CB8455|nr:SusC/RagA family TonB-linked outer membrane protein [Carboxylicivirga sp. A043]MCU4158292.1 SusC/RagA family TonB-linked outer membrane protein [Carboxylicivirga sp. A043]
MKIISKQAMRNKVGVKLAVTLWGIILILFIQGFCEVANAAQQEIKLSINKKNVPLEEIVSEIESKSDYTFMYSTLTAKDINNVSINISDGELVEILELIFKDKPYSYNIEGKVIIIGPREDETEAQQPEEGVLITGTVSDKEGELLVGANVILKGTPLGISTDAQGRFNLKVPAKYSSSNVLSVSFIGMITKEVQIDEQTEIHIVLDDAIEVMGAVVVTGIFNKAPESYTGAAIKVSSKELQMAGNRSVLTSISNIDPSFNIMPDVAYGSDPNRLPDITMRGRTSMDINVRDLQEDSQTQSTANLPLFIMNGFEVSLQRVMDMDEDLVESITLLKDASATALYGSRGANGIVVITTKRPAEGKLRVNYKGSLNIEAPDLTSYNLMNAQEKLDYELAAGLYTYWIGENTMYNQALEELYNERLIDVERGVDTYWLKYPVRTGVGNRHSLQVDGGDNHFKYSAGVSYNNIAGVMKDSYRTTFTGNMFFQYEINNIKFQNELIIAQNKSNNSPYGSFSDYTVANPIYTPYDENGKLKKMLYTEGLLTNNPPTTGNPLYNAKLPSKDESRYTNIQNNFAVEWNISNDLSARGRLGYTKQDNRSDYYVSRDHTMFETSAYEGENYKRRGRYIYGTTYATSYEADITLNYNKTISEVHQLYAGLNLSMSESETEGYNITAEGFAAANMANLGLAGDYPEGSSPQSTEEHYRRLGSILNLNYTYDRRYFIDMSGNLEGSSKFGANDRIAPFWSCGIGWNLHQEEFLRGKKDVNALRLRISYGTSGSQNFSSFQALTTYRYYDSQTYKFWTGSYMMGLGNPDLSWQQTAQTNIGLEASLFNSRIRINVDYYNKMTDGLLTDINIPSSSGFSSYKSNVGEVRNRGVELNVNAYLYRDMERQITWSVGGSLIHNQNKILSISNSLEFLNSELMEYEGSNPSFLYEEGESMNTIYVVRSLGIDPATGDEIFLNKDGNRTNTWDASDKVACGVAEPKVWGNFRTMFRWKNVVLNAVLSYRMGGYVYNQTLVDKVENINRFDAWGNLDRRAYYNRWQNPGDESYFSDISDLQHVQQASSRFVMKENTLEMTSANLSYEFDQQWLNKNLKIDYLTLGLYAENLFYISTIKRERGTSYPFSRKFSLALSARF